MLGWTSGRYEYIRRHPIASVKTSRTSVAQQQRQWAIVGDSTVRVAVVPAGKGRGFVDAI